MKAIVNLLKNQNQWLIAIISSLFFAPLGTVIYDFLKNKSLFSTLLSIKTSIQDFLLRILNIDFKLWHVILILILIIMVLKFIDYSKENTTVAGQIQEEVPDFLNYTTDTFPGNLVWNWEYEKNHNGKYSIINLKPVCQKCDTPLFLSEFMGVTEAHCPRCKSYFSRNTFYRQDHFSLDTPDEIRALIFDNIKRSNRSEKGEKNS